MQTMVHVTSLTPIIRDYRGAITTCQREFNNVNNEPTERGANPGAFQGNQGGPAGREPSAYRIFNDWATETLKKLLVLKQKGELGKTVGSQASFDAWHRGLACSLDEYWSARAHQDYPLSRKQLYKLVNLFVKWLRIKVSDDVRAHIEKHGHTTLNTPTVQRVGELLGDGTLTFPADDEDYDEWYHDTQERIRDFTNTHGGSPVIVDVWCRAAFLADPDQDV